MSIKDVLSKCKQPFQGRSEPLWQGPEIDGITVSLLSLFLVDRERFRIKVVDGIGPKEEFNHRLEYGNFWHVCEESYAKGSDFQTALRDYCRSLCEKNRFQQDQVNHWYRVCAAQFPVYLEYWSEHPDVVNKEPLLQEHVFDVPYKLPSGRKVILRGKMDSVDYIKQGKDIQPGIWLQENKTKGDVRPIQLQRQLRSGFELQTMLYLVALDTELNSPSGKSWQVGVSILRGEMGKKYPLRGVRYNVIRRPLSGGKGSIVRHKPTKGNPRGETENDFYARLQQVIKDNADDFFFRWNVYISKEDIARFKEQFLNPILEQLCDWWSWVSACYKSKISKVFDSTDGCENGIGRSVPGYVHFRMPYGMYNPLLEGGETEIDDYLNTGSMVGMHEVKNLFPELE